MGSGDAGLASPPRPRTQDSGDQRAVFVVATTREARRLHPRLRHFFSDHYELEVPTPQVRHPATSPAAQHPLRISSPAAQTAPSSSGAQARVAV